MPQRIDDCVESVLEDNPDYSESQAYAICHSTLDAKEIEAVTTVEELGVGAKHVAALEGWESPVDGVYEHVGDGLVVFESGGLPREDAAARVRVSGKGADEFLAAVEAKASSFNVDIDISR